MDCSYKSFQIEEYNTQSSYSKILGIESMMLILYHLQIDGQTEQVN